MKKKILIFIVLALILAVAGAITYVLTNLDSIVKAAIEKYGSEAMKTTVRVSSVKISLRNGVGSVRGLTIANPPGFSSPSIMTLDNISIRIAVKSVTGTPIVIDNILISGPEVFYDMKENGTSNVDILKKNLASSGAPREEKPKKGAKGKETRLRIKKLVFEKGKVHVRIAKMMDKPIIVDLPRLEMIDIGKEKGATPDEIGRAVSAALMDEATKSGKAAARTQGKKLLQKGADDLLKKYLRK